MSHIDLIRRLKMRAVTTDEDRLEDIYLFYEAAAALAGISNDEAVERGAEAVYRSHDNYQHFPSKTWAEMVKSKDRANKFRVRQDRDIARAVLAAVAGDSDE